MWNVAHLDRSYDDSVVQQLHMSSADYQPSTHALEASLYTARAAGSSTHQSPQGYYPSTISPNGIAEPLPGFPNHQNMLHRLSNGQVYSANEYSSTDGNPESSSGASFITSRAGSYDSSLPQPVTPESGLGTHIDAYNYMYPHGQGQAGVVVSPPTPSSTTRHQQHHKKPKAAGRQRKPKNPYQGFSPDSLAASIPGNRSKLRSASRTSKNTHHNPPVTAEERKSRETHNNVEKQYRNRLNAHFESLLSALPETMQNGEGEETGDVLDSGDRRVSKAEVLEMARRHIKSLERECGILEGERDELRVHVQRLRWLFGRCEGGDPGGPEGSAFLGSTSMP